VSPLSYCNEIIARSNLPVTRGPTRKTPSSCWALFWSSVSFLSVNPPRKPQREEDAAAPALRSPTRASLTTSGRARQRRGTGSPHRNVRNVSGGLVAGRARSGVRSVECGPATGGNALPRASPPGSSCAPGPPALAVRRSGCRRIRRETRAGHRGRYGVWGLSGRGDGAAHGELRGRGSHGRGPRVSGSFFKRRGSES